MFDYVSSQADADELIREFGAAAVLRRAVAGDYDPNFGEVDDQGEQRFTTVAVEVESKASEVDGSEILATDTKLLITPYLATLPQPQDLIEFSGTVYTIVASRPVKPAGVVVLHQVWGRA
jgi:hypothetical protein